VFPPEDKFWKRHCPRGHTKIVIIIWQFNEGFIRSRERELQNGRFDSIEDLCKKLFERKLAVPVLKGKLLYRISRIMHHLHANNFATWRNVFNGGILYNLLTIFSPFQLSPDHLNSAFDNIYLLRETYKLIAFCHVDPFLWSGFALIMNCITVTKIYVYFIKWIVLRFITLQN